MLKISNVKHLGSEISNTVYTEMRVEKTFFILYIAVKRLRCTSNFSSLKSLAFLKCSCMLESYFVIKIVHS